VAPNEPPPTEAPQATHPATLPTATAPVATASSSHPVDLTNLPLGDSHLVSAPTIGGIWPCRIDPNAGGAFQDGPWIKGTTYDFTARATVDGAVTWQNSLQITTNGGQRVIVSNGVPNHATGQFPIASSDDAYQYDRNPNRIAPQTIRLALPLNPTLAAQPSCAPGEVGILLTGAKLFNALDAPGRDAVARETQDACYGHPQQQGVYHYHALTNCLPDTPTADGHSSLMGYVYDGFGLYGHHSFNGQTLTSADLDECHGHTHTIVWDGQAVEMYHYHATWDFPYAVGCLRGTPIRGASGPP
jgi:hypothetical protein